MEKLYESTNYGLFELHECNRNLHKLTKLMKSMKQHGYIGAYPLHCTRNGNGKLLIKAGHHRFEAAKKMGIAVKYVICDDAMSVQEGEKTYSRWTLEDYLTSYVRTGKPAYIALREYCITTGIGLAMSIGLLGGQSAANNNKTLIDAFKAGDFAIRSNVHSTLVGELVSAAKQGGFAGATYRLFVNALSKVCYVDGLDFARLKASLEKHGSYIQRQPDLQGYLEEIENIYNRQRSKERLPLAFLAMEKTKERQEQAWLNNNTVATSRGGINPQTATKRGRS
jgi:hypothetical protein